MLRGTAVSIQIEPRRRGESFPSTKARALVTIVARLALDYARVHEKRPCGGSRATNWGAARRPLMHSRTRSWHDDCESRGNMMRLEPMVRSRQQQPLWMTISCIHPWRSFVGQRSRISAPPWLAAVYSHLWAERELLTLSVNACWPWFYCVSNKVYCCGCWFPSLLVCVCVFFFKSIHTTAPKVARAVLMQYLWF